jgi:large subunit ribosomal protein L15
MRYKQKKNVRQRGSKTHGCGSMKKRRGAGNRGGRGAAGSGKRGDGKKPSIWKNKKYFGKHGFTSHVQRGIAKPVNMHYIEARAENLIKRGLMRQEGGFFALDLHDLGYHKLLSKGAVTRKYRIMCDIATEKAVEKVKSLGGEVLVKEGKEE